MWELTFPHPVSTNQSETSVQIEAPRHCPINMNTTKTQKINRIIEDLTKAYDVCIGVNYESNDIDDYEKQAPFAVGYSKSALFAALGDLQSLLNENK